MQRDHEDMQAARGNAPEGMQEIYVQVGAQG